MKEYNKIKKSFLNFMLPLLIVCGEGEIRTPDGLSSIHAFQACTLSHSDTSPYSKFNNLFYDFLLIFRLDAKKS